MKIVYRSFAHCSPYQSVPVYWPTISMLRIELYWAIPTYDTCWCIDVSLVPVPYLIGTSCPYRAIRQTLVLHDMLYKQYNLNLFIVQWFIVLFNIVLWFQQIQVSMFLISWPIQCLKRSLLLFKRGNQGHSLLEGQQNFWRTTSQALVFLPFLRVQIPSWSYKFS